MTRKRVCQLLIPVLCGGVVVLGQQMRYEKRKAQVKGYDLQLQNRDGKCVLVYAGHQKKGEMTLGISAPCEFVRDKKGAPRNYTYKNKKVYGGYYTVVIVTGGPLDRTKSDAFMTDGCGTEVQALILQSNKVPVIKRITKDGPTVCPTSGLDEMVYEWLSLNG
jgi:hypothetical protein